MNLPGKYRGSSFIEFLKTDHPDLVPDFGDHDWSNVQMIHGTTVLALVYKDGAIMAGDRLATEGHAVGTRDIEKVFRIDETCCMAIAGAASASDPTRSHRRGSARARGARRQAAVFDALAASGDP